MANDAEKKNNVIDFDPKEDAKVKLMVNNIKTLLELKAKDFADQYVAKQEECPEYLVDSDCGVDLIERQLGEHFTAEDWDNNDLLGIAANAFALVVVDHIAEHYNIEFYEDDDEPEGA